LRKEEKNVFRKLKDKFWISQAKNILLKMTKKNWKEIYTHAGIHCITQLSRKCDTERLKANMKMGIQGEKYSTESRFFSVTSSNTWGYELLF
jgi:hypothetical protein